MVVGSLRVVAAQYSSSRLWRPVDEDEDEEEEPEDRQQCKGVAYGPCALPTIVLLSAT